LPLLAWVLQRKRYQLLACWGWRRSHCVRR
jgi:hypothetical protein